MMHSDYISAAAKAIYEGRNGRGCRPWSRIEAAHKQPYREDAVVAITAYEASKRAREEESRRAWEAREGVVVT